MPAIFTNFGVSNFGVIVGISTLTDIGIGKSTPIIIASPDPKDGKKKEFLYWQSSKHSRLLPYLDNLSAYE